MNNQPNTNANNQAVASLVLGIVSVVLCWTGWFSIVSLALGIVGIVLATKSRTGEQRSMATAGLVLSIIGVVLSGLVFLCAICALGTIGCAISSL